MNDLTPLPKMLMYARVGVIKAQLTLISEPSDERSPQQVDTIDALDTWWERPGGNGNRREGRVEGDRGVGWELRKKGKAELISA